MSPSSTLGGDIHHFSRLLFVLHHHIISMWSQVAQQHYRQEEDEGFSTRYWLSHSGSASCSPPVVWTFWFCCVCNRAGCAALARVDCENREQHKSGCSKKIHLHRWFVTKNVIQMSTLHHCSATNNVRHVYVACGSLSSVWTCWFHSHTHRQNRTFWSIIWMLQSEREDTDISGANTCTCTSAVLLLSD